MIFWSATQSLGHQEHAERSWHLLRSTSVLAPNLPPYLADISACLGTFIVHFSHAPCHFDGRIVISVSTSDDSYAKDDVPGAPLLHLPPFHAKANGPACGSTNGLFAMAPKGPQPLTCAHLDPACSKSP